MRSRDFIVAASCEHFLAKQSEVCETAGDEDVGLPLAAALIPTHSLKSRRRISMLPGVTRIFQMFANTQIRANISQRLPIAMVDLDRGIRDSHNHSMHVLLATRTSAASIDTSIVSADRIPGAAGDQRQVRLVDDRKQSLCQRDSDRTVIEKLQSGSRLRFSAHFGNATITPRVQ